MNEISGNNTIIKANAFCDFTIYLQVIFFREKGRKEITTSSGKFATKGNQCVRANAKELDFQDKCLFCYNIFH